MKYKMMASWSTRGFRRCRKIVYNTKWSPFNRHTKRRSLYLGTRRLKIKTQGALRWTFTQGWLCSVFKIKSSTLMKFSSYKNKLSTRWCKWNQLCTKTLISYFCIPIRLTTSPLKWKKVFSNRRKSSKDRPCVIYIWIILTKLKVASKSEGFILSIRNYSKSKRRQFFR